MFIALISKKKAVKSVRIFKPTLAEKKALAKARKNFLRGDYITLQALERGLRTYARGDGAGPFNAEQADKFLRNL